MALNNFHKILASTPQEIRDMVKDRMDKIEKQRSSKFFYFERSGQSVDLYLLPFNIRRRDGSLKRVYVWEYRRSKLKGFGYISLRICHYIFINIDFHKPI